ncbi:MAG: transcription antitermination factor NusB [Candidatus Omnitrophica bacterium]|nr:transcription antitermination factor NusB [Candidatus Omnitrophota bacterium]MCF7876922.1 transcription antitermination factor NusB [Candidatus Omnitrophota bacterium]MCF7878602.1 transcription antitermination factor NusB [Candidatus Omnitrophota bacterium]MCF7893077.1 transcription antitermination factor NusB [Candidatus Omnitrophota bacterium]
MRSRSKARDIALCLLYQIEISKITPQDALLSSSAAAIKDDSIVIFFSQLIKGVRSNRDKIDSIIKKYAKNWEISRMAVIDRNILRLAVFELFFLDDIPPKVSINEGIELAKRYGDLDSARFVNGILDKIYKTEKSIEKKS